jgi:predicted site-specific integrase-resolvase
METKTISIAAWAKRAGVSRQRAYQWVTAGRLRFVRVRKTVINIYADEPRPDAMAAGRPRKESI